MKVPGLENVRTDIDLVEMSEDSELCASCGVSEKESRSEKYILWIQCYGCSQWYHRNCAGLKHHLKWKKANRKGA